MGAPPILIFADSAYESGVASAGALLVDLAKSTPLVFDGVIPEEVVTKWTANGGQQVMPLQAKPCEDKDYQPRNS